MNHILCLLVVLVSVVSTSCSDSLPNDVPFDSAKWRSGDTRTRGQMVHGLLEQEAIFRGKSKDEVKEILGEPSFEAADIMTYKISWGGMLEQLQPGDYYVGIVFEAASGTVKRLDLLDA